MTNNNNYDGILPHNVESYWTSSIDLPKYPSLENDMQVDVIIVGGGITGITSAYLLVNEGLKVAVIEADKLLNGTTGHTTAKITAQHDMIYEELIRYTGRTTARLYYEANIDALKFIQTTINKHQIDCDFTQQDAYLYATTEEYAYKLEKEAEAYKELHIEGELVNKLPIDLKIHNALVMRNQAQFHPLKYLAHLSNIITEKGGYIFENTTAVNIKTGEQPVVLTRGGAQITGKYILSCSHFPFYEGAGLYSTRMHADRSYIIAAKTRTNYPGGMYISVDEPTRSLRSTTINGEEFILISGESHKTGQGGETLKHYEALEIFGQQVFGLENIPYRWSAQDLITLDKIPYIGEITSDQKNILIATGYRKWGMTNGTAAALLFRDIILKEKNKFRELYTPSRFHMNPSLKNFLVENANVVGHLIKGKLEIPQKCIRDLSNDEGAVVDIDGHRKGAYKDAEGKLHIVDTTCTHIGCEVEWNNGERSWDCPCHGSRFSYTGEVLEGPAEKPLQKYDYKMIDNLTSEDSGY
ncbi:MULTISPECIES: FAD-dependent oxidoreductase [Bacillus cereus group]|uniref:FAD-dependent oxidoreductase n=1 Tax=Bacillus TaxID=1386 RepID=UPI00065BBEE6|nr:MULTISPECIES: FAD-dependent oxidoreductase [Bacillus cereus group]KMP16523.1 (2Fe-2S)-binding protein [Bacillus cereus]MBL3845255.1 FAD-dependent oxidoreductase [Bacillus cereus]MCH5436511.1 FAD-dependent oxidoreductase [Bacillus paranthracis]MCR6792840.1 FAD-dependent oxidoreductase [Bacillus paranthracis]MCU5173410.1 FAD-dependent oxidoreductase [Bacillus paranthracis]